jgi:hypothetical protein
MVVRAGVYAYDVGVWGLSIVQGAVSVTPCQTLMSQERVDQVDSHGRWKGPCL